jgi:ABC-2 type transport system ATP-binding protein
MKIIACYTPPSGGRATVDGFDVMRASMKVRQRVGYLPESNPLYPDMYVREFLHFIAGLHRIPLKKKRIEEMIALTGLDEEAGKKIGQLSKGYRQRVGLAQAMIHDPDVLILDEPSTGLDPNQLAQIRKLIKDLGKTKTIILSTHIMQEVQAICDRVLIIDRGRIVADAPIEELQTRMQGGQIVEVAFLRPMPLPALEALEGATGVFAENEHVFRIGVQPGEEIRTALFELAVRNENPILHMNLKQQGLEEVFRALTSQKDSK